MKRIACLALAVICAVCLTGCQRTPAADTAAATLPPAATAYDPPVGDGAMDFTDSVALYLPSRDGQRLLTQWTSVEMSHSRHSAEAVATALLAFTGNDQVTALGGNVALALYGRRAVEVSGGVCTVNLASSALQLDRNAFYTACLGIAATLTALDDIHYVNVLVAGQAVAMDVAGLLPMGSLTAHPGEELPVLIEQMDARRTPLGEDASMAPINATATLYFPLADGSGVIPETRNLSFVGQTPQQLATGLVQALFIGAQYVSGACAMPDMNALLVYAPSVSEMTDTGGRMVTLSFVEDLDAQLTEAGVDPACFIAALTYTLTTFVPSVAAVQVMVGDTILTSLYNRSHGMLTFSGGLQRRDDFDSYLMAQVTLYFSSGSKLKATLRSVPCREIANPRYLLDLLMAGPTQREADAGLEPTLPSDLTDGDLIGLALTGDTLLINLSAHFADRIRTDAAEYEQVLCYSIVNTLCEVKGLKRARFFFGGSTTEQLCGDVYWGGEFLLCPGLIDRTMG